MRRSFVTDARRERVIEPWAVAVMVAVIAALLVLAFPGRLAIQRADYQGGGDAVSRAYLRVLARAYPRDRNVQLNYVRELIGAGRLDQARAELRRWLDPLETASTRALVLSVEITAGLLFERRAPPAERRRLRRQLTRRMRALWRRPLPRERLRALAGRARSVAENALAGLMYAQAATAGSAVARQDLIASARAFRAAGSPQRASAQYRRARTLVGELGYRELTDRLIEMWLAAGRPGRAMGALRDAVMRYSDDAALLDRGIELALAAERPEVALDWARRWLALQGSHARRGALRRVYRLERMTGRTAAAAATARRLLQRGDTNPALRAQLAQLLEGSGRSRAALRHWRWLVINAPAYAQDRDVVALARANYSFDTVITVLRARARRRPLDRVELAALREAAHEGQHPDRALSTLRALIAREPQRARYWDSYLRLIGERGNPGAVSAAYRDYAERFPVGPQRRQRWARALMAQGRNEAALAVLDPPAPPRRAGAVFWALRADLAWRLEALEPALSAYARLSARGRLNTRQGQRYVRVARRLAPTARVAEVALAAAEQTRDSRLAVMGMEAALQADAAEAGRELVRLGRDIAARSGRFWTLAARYWQGRSAFERADAAFERALTLSPAAGRIRAAYLWYLLERGRDQEALRRARAWSADASVGSELAAAMAVAYGRNAREREALKWYGRVAAVRAKDWLWLLSYADTLDGAGRGGAAYRLRRYVLASLADDTSAPRSRAAWRAAQGLGQSRAAWHRVAAAMQQEPGGAFWYRALAQWYLERDHVAGARAVLIRAHRERLELPVWQRMSIALRRGDQRWVARLLRDHSVDSPATRARALARTGRNGAALATSAAALGDADRSGGDDDALRSQTLALSNQRPHGVRVTGRVQDFGRVRLAGVEASLSRPVGRWQLDLSAQRWDVTDGGPVATADGSEAVSVSLEAEHRTAARRWSLAAEVERRAGEALNGGELRWRERVSDRLSWVVGVGAHQVPTLSGPLRLLGRRNQVVAGIDARIGSRTSWSLRGRWRRYEARRGGAAIGEGGGVTATITERMAAGDPDWALRSTLTWQRYHRADALPGELADRVTDTPSIGGFLPRRSATATIASRWTHGRPARLRGRASSPRYTVSIAGGWREPQGEPVVSLNGGFGWRVFGTGELALRGQWARARDPVGGQTRARVELTYTRWWGP